MTRVALAALIVLHGPNGRDIFINPAAVTSMHAAIEGKKNELFTETARCLINTSDGKFISVVESCEKVRELFASQKGDNQ